MLYLFTASAFLILYVLFGYPLLLALLTRFFRRPVERRFVPRTVSIVIPVHNGDAWIPAKVQTIGALDYPRHLLQVVFVDDGSTDGTAELLKKLPAGVFEVITVPRGGKAAALNAGIARARGEILFFTDIRQRLDPSSLLYLVECFADRAVGVVSGELVILSGDTQEETDIGLYWRYEKWIRKHQSALGSVPGATGSIYAMRRELAVVLPPQTLLDDVHLPIAAFFKGYRIIFEERARAYDHPTALSSEFRRKVRTQAGVYQLMGAFPRLLFPTSRMCFHFCSHKLGRLMLPFALILIAVSSMALPEPARALSLLAQVAVYGAAALDRVLAASFPLKRASSFARTFVVLVSAALCAPVFMLTRRDLGWSVTQISTVSTRAE